MGPPMLAPALYFGNTLVEGDRLVGRFQGLPAGATLILARAGR